MSGRSIPNPYQPAPFQKKLEVRMRNDIFRSDLIIADSEWTRRKLLELDLVAPDKCVAIPLGVSIPSIPTDADISAPVRPVLSQSYVLFVGRIENRKNLGHIVDAVMPLKNLSLVIVGEPGFGYDDIAVRDLARFPSERLIRFSRLAQADLTALYQHATATLLPSWEEGFGMPVLEAMAAGSPVITSDRSSCAEVAGDAGVLVSPDEPSASTEALRRLLDDQPYRHALIAAGTHRAREFTWERYGGTLTQLYARVVAEG